MFDSVLASKVRDLIAESKTVKRKSQELLQSAKARVEQLIEEAVKS
jgi:hypothetical protein